MNKWIVRNNRTSRRILHFMKWSGCESLDDLAEIPFGEIIYLIQRYIQRLRYIDIEKDVGGFVESIKLFYKVNGIHIKKEFSFSPPN